jgi:hypothetical protein
VVVVTCVLHPVRRGFNGFSHGRGLAITMTQSPSPGTRKAVGKKRKQPAAAEAKLLEVVGFLWG